MKYHQLGSSGLRISEVILGSATFGELVDGEDVGRLIDAAVDVGVNTIDTGDVYGLGHSEEAVGRAIARHRDRVVVCTKVGFRVGDPVDLHGPSARGELDELARWREGISPNDQGLSRAHLFRAVDASLARLGVDHIDLYQVHRWDPHTPLEETLEALTDLVRMGKVRYLGCSGFAGWQLMQSLWASDVRHLEAFRTIQAPYSLVARAAATDPMPAATAAGIGVLVFSPLAGGMLTGRYAQGREPEAGSRMAARPMYRDRYWRESVFSLIERLRVIADESGRAVSELAIGWLLAHPQVNAVLVGAERVDELTQNLAVVERPLGSDELEAIEHAVAAEG